MNGQKIENVPTLFNSKPQNSDFVERNTRRTKLFLFVDVTWNDIMVVF